MAIDLTWLNQQFPDLTQLQILGQGGQKYVFSALHPREGDVVLKLIHPHQDPETVRREILAVAQVRSPRVPEILEQGVVNTAMGSFVWIRERRVIGEQLRALLRFGPFPISEVLRMSGPAPRGPRACRGSKDCSPGCEARQHHARPERKLLAARLWYRSTSRSNLYDCDGFALWQMHDGICRTGAMQKH
jgi:hypothetical protein